MRRGTVGGDGVRPAVGSRAVTGQAAAVAARVTMLRFVCRDRAALVTGDDLVRERTAATLLGWSPKTLRNDRAGAKRVAFVKRGRAVLYDLHELARWMEANSEAG